MGLAVADWERINASLVRLYRELDTDAHARVVLQVIHELVAADSLCFNFFKPPETWRLISIPEKFAPAKVMRIARKYSHQSPFGAYYLATQDASWKMLTDFMPLEDFQQLEFYRLACAPLGINHLLGGMLGVVDGTAHIVILHRTHRPFTERDREILNALHPHLVTSFLNALLFRAANRSITQLQAVLETAPGAYGCFNEDGSLAWLQPLAQKWLQEFFPHDTRSRAPVPRRVRSLLTAAQQDATLPQAWTQSASGESLKMFLVKSSLGGWLLRLERKSKTAKPHFQALAQLSPRENEVLRWMVEGKRNAEIAAILDISSRTVEKHVQKILTTLKVENRASAILRSMDLCAAAQLPQ